MRTTNIPWLLFFWVFYLCKVNVFGFWTIWLYSLTSTPLQESMMLFLGLRRCLTDTVCLQAVKMVLVLLKTICFNIISSFKCCDEWWRSLALLLRLATLPQIRKRGNNGIVTQDQNVMLGCKFLSVVRPGLSCMGSEDGLGAALWRPGGRRWGRSFLSFLVLSVVCLFLWNVCWMKSRRTSWLAELQWDWTTFHLLKGQ